MSAGMLLATSVTYWAPSSPQPSWSRLHPHSTSPSFPQTQAVGALAPHLANEEAETQAEEAASNWWFPGLRPGLLDFRALITGSSCSGGAVI